VQRSNRTAGDFINAYLPFGTLHCSTYFLYVSWNRDNARNGKRIRLNIFIIGYQFYFCFHDFPIEFWNTSYGVIFDFILFTMHLFYFIIIIIIIIIILAFNINFCQLLFFGKPCISDYEIKGRVTVTNLIIYHKWPEQQE
jgi:hypothetical protein